MKDEGWRGEDGEAVAVDSDGTFLIPSIFCHVAIVDELVRRNLRVITHQAGSGEGPDGHWRWKRSPLRDADKEHKEVALKLVYYHLLRPLCLW